MLSSSRWGKKETLRKELHSDAYPLNTDICGCEADLFYHSFHASAPALKKGTRGGKNLKSIRMFVCPLYTSGHGYTVGSCPAERDLTMMPSPELKQLPLNMTTTMNDEASFIDRLRQRLSLPNPYPPLERMFRQICCSRLEQGGCELSQSEATLLTRNALLSLFVAVACFLSSPPKVKFDHWRGKEEYTVY